jgi:hypothetical protein
MIQLDLTKALHPRTFGYFAPLMPGLFFEISILLSGSYSFRKLADQAQLGYYTSLVVVLILAFILGNGFLLLVRLIQLTIGLSCRCAAFAWKKVLSGLLRLIRYLFSRPRRLPVRVAMRLQQLGRSLEDQLSPSEPSQYTIALADATTVLLKERYGIELHPVKPNWGAWFDVFGIPPKEYQRGSLMVMASEATGWCGVIAARIAPALRSRYYLSFSVFLVLYGLLSDWSVARGRNDPDFLNFIRLRAVLKEIREARNTSQKPTNVNIAENEDDLG